MTNDNADFQDNRIMYCVYQVLCSIMFCTLCTKHFTGNVEREQKHVDNKEGKLFW